ncbi:hypothetical protein M595_3411 [Lyngbya aestuarii BL J]|uniref:Uncharacterized protein n=1 Tax=Lyngbya aestuarii BL J TaxID=1348334 RepID=U7QHU4_9CYAN|nr:hypothetical protein M595_3411 [Lyngbya aestuarii BL J]
MTEEINLAYLFFLKIKLNNYSKGKIESLILISGLFLG